MGGEKLEEKFANRLQKQVDKGGFAWRACQKKAGEMKGGMKGGRGRKFMSTRPDDPETGEAQAHKNALCTLPPQPPFTFTPLCFFSLILSFTLYFPQSLCSLARSLSLSCSGGGGSQLSDVLGGCVRFSRGHGSHIFLMAESLKSTRLGGLLAFPPSFSLVESNTLDWRSKVIKLRAAVVSRGGCFSAMNSPTAEFVCNQLYF